MVGVNILKLNQATLIYAVQYWLDAQLLNRGPVVTRVHADGNDFEVTINSSEHQEVAHASQHASRIVE